MIWGTQVYSIQQGIKVMHCVLVQTFLLLFINIIKVINARNNIKTGVM
jgi:hypothetical protein